MRLHGFVVQKNHVEYFSGFTYQLILVARRAAIHWDDADLPREVVMRPAGAVVPEWHWSGSFRLTTR